MDRALNNLSIYCRFDVTLMEHVAALAHTLQIHLLIVFVTYIPLGHTPLDLCHYYIRIVGGHMVGGSEMMDTRGWDHTGIYIHTYIFICIYIHRIKYASSGGIILPSLVQSWKNFPHACGRIERRCVQAVRT